MDKGSSTAASGPAGTHFEGQVAAFYMLAMLCGAPPRGLPGTSIDRIALQQANTGRPLDDVIIHAIDISARPAVLEIQVKRTITFTPADHVFKKVVGQIAQAARRSDFWSTNYNLAIATSRGSRKIDGPYQDLLSLARQIGDEQTFTSQIKLSGVANDDMRSFVTTFQCHLRDEGAPHDDETTWKLLRRLQILTFDFTATGSASEDLARERALRTLHADDATRVDAFWSALIELAFDIAKSGGDRNRNTLLDSLQPLGFRFIGERRYANARTALAEHGRQSLADIDIHIGKVVLARHERVSAVHAALDSGRYVEIRGDAGVGKSGILRQLAESLQTGGNFLFLSPGRCVPRGWSAMRAQIGFEGTLRDLLVDLANDGGGIFFLDNLDSFNDEERHTVVDILREVALVQGISVLATARTEFGVEEPSWLPAEALDRLKRAPVVTIDELNRAEIEQLSTGDPALVLLLRENHPARQVTRNLFRLARIALQPVIEPLPRTEAEMALQWWSSADGKRGTGWRERARLLDALARQALAGPDLFDVSTQPAEFIDALVRSGTLRSLGPNRVSFRHDVLREWAIACVLKDDSNLLKSLDLKRLASATQGRGTELAARMMIERAADGSQWSGFLARLSEDGSHKSWRRAALLAPARSEAADALLPRIQSILFSDQAVLLRELLRTVMAVDVAPASNVFAPLKVDPNLTAGLMIPKGAAWLALVIWLLGIGDGVPAEAIPEVIDLYTIFSVGTLGITEVTPLTTQQLYRWLRLMEPRNFPHKSDEAQIFWNDLERDHVQFLREALRSSFFMFARYTPDLAAEYLRAVGQDLGNDNIARSILMMRGTLAQAAPEELARLTEQALIERPRPRGHWFDRERREPFTLLDKIFIPVSPAQGPFFELLVHSPANGLALIHRLIDHAITHGADSQSPGEDLISLAYEEGVRDFPWTDTYFWSRQSNYYAITSSLMALEAWAHKRIESGESFGQVLKDVLGPPGSCAAFLLVAVDLIISHWPKSTGSAAEFLGCPELLCLDRTRQQHDQFEVPDFLGVKALMKPEPRGPVNVAGLKGRVSRQKSLDDLIGNYALSVDQTQLTRLTSLLHDAAARLGSASAQDNLGNPELMVLHALNLADPANWPEFDAEIKNGSKIRIRQYVSPPSEEAHFRSLRNTAANNQTDYLFQTSITFAIDDPSRWSVDQLQSAIAWASHSAPTPAADESDAGLQTMRREAVLGVAMMVMRNGDSGLVEAHGAWARAQLQDAIASDEHNPVLQVRAGLRFNPIAIAYTGLIHALSHRNTPDDVRALLDVAAGYHHAAAHGFGASVHALLAVDARLPCAILRCALRACVVPVHKWDISEEEKASYSEVKKTAAQIAVDAEMDWIQGSGSEPAWPAFPKKDVRPKRHIQLRVPAIESEEATHRAEAPPPTEVVHHQSAALWLRQIQSLENVGKVAWLLDVVNTYMQWTIEANGGYLDKDEEVDDTPMEWNATFFALVACCTVGLTATQVSDIVTAPIVRLPDQNFFDILTDFLRSFDEIYFNGDGIDTAVAVATRLALADRLMKCWGWERLKSTKDMSIERHIASAIATLFFNDYHFDGKTQSYLLEKGAERIEPFLPILNRLIISGPSPFVALVLLNVLSVAPRSTHLGLLLLAARTWLAAYTDFRLFWIDHGIGKRWCEIVQRIHMRDPGVICSDVTIRTDLESMTAELVALGVAEASQLEELIRHIP